LLGKTSVGRPIVVVSIKNKEEGGEINTPRGG